MSRDGSRFGLYASRLDVALQSSATEGRRRSLELDLQRISGVPVKITNESVSVASDRQFDEYRIGGARYAGYDGSRITNFCTTGFSVRNLDGQEGLLTAAHCGPTGRQFGPFDAATNTIALYGRISVRYEQFDAAVIPTATGGPFIYVGSHTSGSVTRVDGTRDVVANSEICYSGSYSGLSCGHFVSQPNTSWRPEGFANPIRGFRTDRRDTIPAVGQGDSGGPGYLLTRDSTGSTTARFAAGVISAITGQVREASERACLGLEQARKCSPSVLSGKTWDINQNTPWNIQRP